MVKFGFIQYLFQNTLTFFWRLRNFGPQTFEKRKYSFWTSCNRLSTGPELCCSIREIRGRTLLYLLCIVGWCEHSFWLSEADFAIFIRQHIFCPRRSQICNNVLVILDMGTGCENWLEPVTCLDSSGLLLSPNLPNSCLFCSGIFLSSRKEVDLRSTPMCARYHGVLIVFRRVWPYIMFLMAVSKTWNWVE